MSRALGIYAFGCVYDNISRGLMKVKTCSKNGCRPIPGTGVLHRIKRDKGETQWSSGSFLCLLIWDVSKQSPGGMPPQPDGLYPQENEPR